MISFGMTPSLIDNVSLISKISGIKCELSEIDEAEHIMDVVIADYINAKDGLLDESDVVTIAVIRDTIAQERKENQKNLAGLEQLQSLDSSSLPRQ